MKNIQLFADGIKPSKSLIDNLIAQGITGATANPSLAKNHLPMPYEEYSCFILDHFYPFPVSVQVLSTDVDEMYEQAQKIALWGENVYVKIPVVTINGESNATLIMNLLKEGIKVNVTAIFTYEQVLALWRAGLDQSYDCVLSVFCGRIADTGILPMAVMEEIAGLIDFGGRGQVKLLWAGVRSMLDVKLAERWCDIITLPQVILDKLPMQGKDLDEYCTETVQMFANDSKNFTI